MRSVLAVLTALAILLAAPAASLAECLRCPPDCPMHAASAAGDTFQHEHDAHDAKGPAAHAGHAAAADDDCHRAPAPQEDDGPCLGRVCGHMDPSLVLALPPGVMPSPSAIAPIERSAATLRAAAPEPLLGLPAPPAEPPRSPLA